jgi:hypothetical protein
MLAGTSYATQCQTGFTLQLTLRHAQCFIVVAAILGAVGAPPLFARVTATLLSFRRCALVATDGVASTTRAARENRGKYIRVQFADHFTDHSHWSVTGKRRVRNRFFALRYSTASERFSFFIVFLLCIHCSLQICFKSL